MSLPRDRTMFDPIRFTKENFLAKLPFILKAVDALGSGKEYEIVIRRKTKAKSNEANSYFWVLCGRLAKKLGKKKEEVYRNQIRDIGENYTIVPIRNDAVEDWIKKIWSGKGLGWVCDIVGPSKIDGYTNIMCYYGSSIYDSEQMSRLIDNIVQDCEAVGIPTKTPNEIARLKALWGEK